MDADSFGDGLLGHQRAYLQWLDSVFARYPELIIENCSSGGLRMDYALLSRHSIQSTSDQEDYRRYATISANAPSALTPEQWVSLGLKSGPKTYVALWRRGSASPVCTLPVKHLLGRQAEARCLYPARGDCSFRWNPEAGSLTAELPHPMSARLFELTTGD